MSARLPPEAFDYYIALGAARNYEAVAKHFGVDKRTVVRAGVRGAWRARLAEIEAAERAASLRLYLQRQADLLERGLKEWEFVERSALEGLRKLPMTTAANCVRALELAGKRQALLLQVATALVQAQGSRKHQAQADAASSDDDLDEIELDDDDGESESE